MAGISSSNTQEPMPTSTAVRQENHEKTKILVRATSLPLPRNVASLQGGKSLEKGATNLEKVSKTVSFECQAPRYEWLKEIEVPEPSYFVERKNRRTFLENVRASQAQRKEESATADHPSLAKSIGVVKQGKQEKQARKRLRSTSLPLSSNMAAKRDVVQGAVCKETIQKTVYYEPQAPRYEWLKNMEVSEPRYFVEKKNRRMFLERVRISQAQSQKESMKADLSSLEKSIGVVKQEKHEKQAKNLLRSTSLPLSRNMNPHQEEKPRLDQGAVSKETIRKTVSLDSKYLLEKKNRRMFLAKVRASQAQTQDEAVKADLSSLAKSIGVVKQEKQAKHLLRTTSLSLFSDMNPHQKEKLHLAQGAVSKETIRKTVSFDSQSPRYEWLKEIEIPEPRYFLERKNRRLFLERARASQAQSQEEAATANLPSPAKSIGVVQEIHKKQARKLLRSTSLPLSCDVNPHQAEKSHLDQGAVSKETIRKAVSFRSQAPKYDWLKEMEVSEPKYFIEKKNRRMFLERVRASQAQSQEQSVNEDLSSPVKSIGVIKQEKHEKRVTKLLRSPSLPLSSDVNPHQTEKVTWIKALSARKRFKKQFITSRRRRDTSG